jgi:hypothetical protein
LRLKQKEIASEDAIGYNNNLTLCNQGDCLRRFKVPDNGEAARTKQEP